MEANLGAVCRGRSRNFKRGGGGVRRNFLQKGGGGGVQPLTREQFVLQINKIFSKKGGGQTPCPPPPPCDANNTSVPQFTYFGHTAEISLQHTHSALVGMIGPPNTCKLVSLTIICLTQCTCCSYHDRSESLSSSE